MSKVQNKNNINDDLCYCLSKLHEQSPDTLARIRRIIDKQDDRPDTYVKQEDVVRMFGIGRSTLWRLVKAGKLHLYTIGNGVKRFRLSEVQTLLSIEENDREEAYDGQ